MRIIFQILIFLLFALPVNAKPVVYVVNKSASDIAFKYDFGQEQVTGQFRDYQIKLTIDFDVVSKSSVDVTLFTKSANAGFPFATQALLGPKVLDAEQFPNIQFTSTKFSIEGQKITIGGQITVRGITKPLTLTARLFRGSKTTVGERDNLRIRISGKINRFDFGADGFATAVGRELTIAIDATINKKP